MDKTDAEREVREFNDEHAVGTIILYQPVFGSAGMFPDPRRTFTTFPAFVADGEYPVIWINGVELPVCLGDIKVDEVQP